MSMWKVKCSCYGDWHLIALEDDNNWPTKCVIFILFYILKISTYRAVLITTSLLFSIIFVWVSVCVCMLAHIKYFLSMNLMESNQNQSCVKWWNERTNNELMNELWIIIINYNKSSMNERRPIFYTTLNFGLVFCNLHCQLYLTKCG